ncbi:hypothetical protein [Salinimicrobium flavum]|uniref:Uncharacterized protein n=1 Tax=Salinimicrobium flavum TaxID=1737065 RepID=A0ABW5IYK1_9FLAO
MEPERKLKLIWDFKGPDANITARHHAAHLRDFIHINKLSMEIVKVEELSPAHSIASMVVADSEMPSVRDALKPHRGQVYEN